MNKKFLTFSILSLFVIGIVTAGLISNYFTHNATFANTNPISVSGETTFSQSVMGGDIVDGSGFTISNNGNVPISVDVSDDAEDGITVSYFGNLQLTKKTVDFSKNIWEIPSDAEKVNVQYSVIGGKFEAVSELPEGYELIYYKDKSDRFNEPANAIKVSNVDKSLPYNSDANADEYDYYREHAWESELYAPLSRKYRLVILKDWLDKLLS